MPSRIYAKIKSSRIKSVLQYYGPALDLFLGGFGPKVNTNVRGYEYFIPTKFGKYSLNDLVVKADYVFPYIILH